MSVDLFAGNRVSDFETAKAWYERLLGAEPSFLPHATEAVWEVGSTASSTSSSPRAPAARST